MSGDTPNTGDANATGPDADSRFEPDPETREFLRTVADDVRGDSSESEQVAALLYRVSDLYDPKEDTDPRDVYVNMREILRVKERGGMDG